MNDNLFDGKLFSLEMEEIIQLGKESVEILNVILGYHKKAIQLRGRGLDLELVYIGENISSQNIEGYEFQYKFESVNHVEKILGFCFFINDKFPLENSLNLYNTYIDQLRNLFTLQGIEVITQTDIDDANDRYGMNLNFFMAKSPLIYLRTFSKKAVYRELFQFDYTLFKDELDKKYVYLIFCNSNGYFKIGYSKTPLKREKTLQAEEPDISLIKIWEKDKTFERFLHLKYSHLRVRGEWFNLTIRELIELKGL